jgi:hypothetical protein
MVDLCPVRDVSSQRKKVDDISFLQLTMTCLSPPRRILHKIWCGRLRQTRAVWKARRMRLEEVRRGDWCHLTQMLFFLFQFQSQGDVSSFLVIHPYFQSPPDCLCLRHRRLDLANTHQFWVPRGGRILRWIQIKEWSDRPKRGTKSVHFFFSSSSNTVTPSAAYTRKVSTKPRHKKKEKTVSLKTKCFTSPNPTLFLSCTRGY